MAYGLLFPSSMRAVPVHTRSDAVIGFSLIEVLIAVVLVGVLAAVGAPSIARSFSTMSVDREARAIHSRLAQARTHAIAHQRDYRFMLNADGSYEVQHAEGGAWVVDGGSSVKDGITVEIGGSSSGEIVFRPHGRVLSPTTIVIHDGRHEREIPILASGMPRWKSGRR